MNRIHLIVISTAIICGVVVGVIYFLNNYEQVPITSIITDMKSEKTYDYAGSTSGFTDSEGIYHSGQSIYEFQWHYYVYLQDGHSEEISEGDYIKLEKGDSFTYFIWVSKSNQ